MKIEEGFKGAFGGSLIISLDMPILMQCIIISLFFFPADRQMWSEDDRSDQQRVPQASLKETTGEGRCPDS